MITNNYILCGSKSLVIRGLLHRKVSDIDLLTDLRTSKLQKFAKPWFKIDLVNIKMFREYDDVPHKGYVVKCMKVEDVLYFKYIFMKRIQKHFKDFDNKHRKDLINVFHNLGKDKSNDIINKMLDKHPTHIDTKELYELMQIGINNQSEI